MTSAFTLFQRIQPITHNTASPIARICYSPVSFRVIRPPYDTSTALQKHYQTIETQVVPHSNMHKPGEINPLGHYSPYILPYTIPGIRRAPRPIEDELIPGSERLVKIRRPSLTGPFAEYHASVGKWHSFVDEHISSCLTSVYLCIGFIVIFLPHNLTFREVINILDS